MDKEGLAIDLKERYRKQDSQDENTKELKQNNP